MKCKATLSAVDIRCMNQNEYACSYFRYFVLNLLKLHMWI